MRTLPDFWPRELQDPIRSFQRRMDRLIGDLQITDWLAAGSGKGAAFLPPAEIVETEKAYLVSLDIPGMPKEDVKVELGNDLLTVSGERKQETEDKSRNLYHSERAYGFFRRVFALPPGVAHDRIEAGFENGTLTITLPKAVASQPKKIPVSDRKVEAKRDRNVA